MGDAVAPVESLIRERGIKTERKKEKLGFLNRTRDGPSNSIVASKGELYLLDLRDKFVLRDLNLCDSGLDNWGAHRVGEGGMGSHRVGERRGVGEAKAKTVGETVRQDSWDSSGSFSSFLLGGIPPFASTGHCATIDILAV